MTVRVPTSVASVTVHASGDLAFEHTHAPGDRPDLDNAGTWGLACDPVCERAIVSGFDAWRDGDAVVSEGGGRVDVYPRDFTVSPDEIDEAESDASPEPAVPVFNITVNTPKQKRQKRQKRPRVTVEATVEPPNVTVPITVEAPPPPPPRRTSVRRRKDGTMIVESEPSPTNTDRGGPK